MPTNDRHRVVVTYEVTERRHERIDYTDSGWGTELANALNEIQKQSSVPVRIVSVDPVFPRSGGTLACGCWNFKDAMPGSGPGSIARCVKHGDQPFVRMNVEDPEFWDG